MENRFTQRRRERKGRKDGKKTLRSPRRSGFARDSCYPMQKDGCFQLSIFNFQLAAERRNCSLLICSIFIFILDACALIALLAGEAGAENVKHNSR
jgi:hypothetical protein